MQAVRSGHARTDTHTHIVAHRQAHTHTHRHTHTDTHTHQHTHTPTYTHTDTHSSLTTHSRNPTQTKVKEQTKEEMDDGWMKKKEPPPQKKKKKKKKKKKNKKKRNEGPWEIRTPDMRFRVSCANRYTKEPVLMPAGDPARHFHPANTTRAKTEQNRTNKTKKNEGPWEIRTPDMRFRVSCANRYTKEPLLLPTLASFHI